MLTATKNPPSKNGAASKQAPEKKGENSALALATSTEMQRELTIAETLEKVNHLKQLLDRREALAQKRSELRKFKFGKEESSAVLTLVDQNENQFQTSNSNLIEMLVTRLEELFSEKINEFTDEIIDFEF